MGWVGMGQLLCSNGGVNIIKLVFSSSLFSFLEVVFSTYVKSNPVEVVFFRLVKGESV